MFKNHTKSENIKTFINYLIKSICYHSTVFEKFIYISGNYSTILIYRMKTNLFSKYGLVLLLGFFLIQSSVFGQTKTITGRVTDAADNTALPGVTVTVKGTTVATQTNVDGQYSIAVPSSNSVLVFTFVGMVTHEEAVGNRSQVDVGLKSDQAALDEVVVIGYGTVKKKDLTGAVSVVKVSELIEQPTSNIANQLQGRASGITVLGTGQPGTAPQIRIRGINSFGNNAPLYIVDGMPTQDINNLNPNDLESMQVLKDAAAASIYGSRAANGVIIITTKKGKGKVKVNYDGFMGTQQVAKGNVYNLLDPQGMADLKWLVYKNSGLPLSDAQYGSGATPVLPNYIVPTGASTVNEALYNVNPYYTNSSDVGGFYRIVKANKEGTDWFHEVFKDAPMQSHNVSVSGGGTQGGYLFSLNYYNQQGNLMNTYLERYTLRSNSQYNVNSRIRVGENLAVAFVDNPTSGFLEEGSAIGMSYRQQPIIPVYDINGNFAGSFGSGLGNARNPVAQRVRAKDNKGLTTQIMGNIFAEADILKNLVFRTNFGGSTWSSHSNSFSYPEYENAENNTTNSYYEYSGTGFNWTWSNTLTYDFNLGTDHVFKVMAGTESNYGRSRWMEGRTLSYFSFDPNYTTLSTGSGTQTNGSGRGEDALFSYFGRVDYSLFDKYLLSATIRRDGSSKFVQNFGVFPAFSAAWKVKDEDFMQDVNWLSDLKIRGGWGKVGNQFNVSQANQFTTYGQNRGSAFYDITGSSNGTAMGFIRTRIGNPNAKWEEVVNTNVGFDAGFFNNALVINFDWYKKQTNGLLFAPDLPATVGQGTRPTVNIGSMRNQGIDMTIYGEKNVNRDLQLNATLTFTTYNNEILKVSDGATYFDQEGRRFNGATIVRNQVGQSIGQFFGYQIEGFWNSQAEIDAANAKAGGLYQDGIGVGRFRYKDMNGDGKITPLDRTFLGNPNPDFTYGINLGAKYKAFDFSIFLYGVQGNDIWNQVKWWTDFYPSFQGAKSLTALHDSWTPTRQNATAPIQEVEGSFSTNNVPNSYYIENGSYLRAKTTQLGYRIPSSALSKLKIESARIYIQAANLFTFTKYSGPDPEVGQSRADGSTAFGLDEGTYPNTKQFLIGLNLSF
ncbi:TonB-dependent receptor plug [Leadbetterella byssophila DSM 17132]|uniref:TonB-dependent receptor plug n=2 Tax=Leadbetterella TaxID=319458 RepID=E4RTW5_LEAB4|nr:TonB-dependent receptor plug [Leadbetterella byssophila DSM 17132]